MYSGYILLSTLDLSPEQSLFAAIIESAAQDDEFSFYKGSLFKAMCRTIGHEPDYILEILKQYYDF